MYARIATKYLYIANTYVCMRMLYTCTFKVYMEEKCAKMLIYFDHSRYNPVKMSKALYIFRISVYFVWVMNEAKTLKAQTIG